MFRIQRPRRLLALGLACTFALGACGNNDDGGAVDSAGGDTEAAGGELSGAITIDGSSTVAPLSEAVAEEFKSEQPDVDVSVATSGTGGGFTKFCNDEIDIAGASRAIKEEEVSACQSKGVEYLEIRVGLDGLAVVTSAENDFVECLSFEQLANIFKEGGASTWDQIDPAFPKEKIAIFAPGTDSGTYDFFNEEILGDPDDGGMKARADYTASENDNTLVQGISGERNSWGFFGYAYYQENRSTLKAIGVSEEAGGDCVTPSNETVSAGDYPLSRPLFVYVKAAALSRPEVMAFMEYYLETAPELTSEVGYTPAPEADYEKGLADLEAAAA